jgi:hypothetical protein
MIAPIVIAWIKVRDREDTEVAKAFATSFAPMFQASRKANPSPTTNIYVNCGRAAMVLSVLRLFGRTMNVEREMVDFCVDFSVRDDGEETREQRSDLAVISYMNHAIQRMVAFGDRKSQQLFHEIIFLGHVLQTNRLDHVGLHQAIAMTLEEQLCHTDQR